MQGLRRGCPRFGPEWIGMAGRSEEVLGSESCGDGVEWFGAVRLDIAWSATEGLARVRCGSAR